MTDKQNSEGFIHNEFEPNELLDEASWAHMQG